MLLLPVVAGCQEADYAEKRSAMRAASIDKVVATAERREASNPDRMRASEAWIDEALRREADATAENAEEIRQRWIDECQSWVDRQPNMRKTGHRIWWGNPEQIERSAITMFY